MELTIFTGLYIRKNYDFLGDDLFKSIYQLIIEDDRLYMIVIDGPYDAIGFGEEVTYEDLESEFINISNFILDSNYIGYNAARIPKDDDLYFTGFIDEKTGYEADPCDLSFQKRQVILFAKDGNMLMYYDENAYDHDDLYLLKGLFFLNGDYPTDNWLYLEDYRDLYKSKSEIINYMYENDTIASNKVRIK